EASPITTDDMVEAANVFLTAHEFALAERYFGKARAMGASDEAVAIGLADTFIAQGKDREAEKTLAMLGKSPDFLESYDYQLALGNIYNQQHDNLHAVSAFAHANQVAEDDVTAERALQDVAGEQGTQVLPTLSMRNGLSTAPVFVDPTIYEMDN